MSTRYESSPRGFADIIGDLLRQVTTLVRNETMLARSEIADGISKAMGGIPKVQVVAHALGSHFTGSFHYRDADCTSAPIKEEWCPKQDDRQSDG